MDHSSNGKALKRWNNDQVLESLKHLSYVEAPEALKQWLSVFEHLYNLLEYGRIFLNISCKLSLESLRFQSPKASMHI